MAFSWTVASTGPGWLMVCVHILMREHQKAQLKVILEKPGIETGTPGLQGIALIHYTTDEA